MSGDPFADHIRRGIRGDAGVANATASKSTQQVAADLPLQMQRRVKVLSGFDDLAHGDLMPMQSAGRVLRGMVAELAEDMSQPAARAGLGASLLTSALLARARMGFIPTVVIALMLGVSVEHLYRMAEDIHEKLTADAAQPV